MKRPIRTATVGLGVMLLLSGAWAMRRQAQGSTHTTDEIQILALENAWNQAELHNDPAALKLILTDDFLITGTRRIAAQQAAAHGVRS